MKPKTFLVSNDDGVRWIRLNRPEKLNALTFEVYDELTAYFTHLQKDDGAKVVVITGSGRGFCSGGDVNLIISELVKMNVRQHLDFTRVTCELIKSIRLLRKPVIACVNGAATGAGACIALACDVRIVSTEAKFAFLFPKVGLSGADMGACYLLPRVVGLGRATELLLTGEIIDAQEAYRIGLANKVVEPQRLEKSASDFALKLRHGPLFAHYMTKTLINDEFAMGFTDALSAEAAAQAICMQNSDFSEAYSAYKDKREPRFNRDS